MKRGIRIVVAGGLVALVAAVTAWAAAPPSGPDPAVKEWPAWPYLTSCGYAQFYPVTAFSGNAEAELGSSPGEVALREALQRGEIPYVRSTHHWRRIAEDETHAEFVHGRLAGHLEWARFEKSEGEWKYTGGSSDCDPTSIVGSGTVVTWSLAEPGPGPKAVVRRIKVDLGPGPCNGGRPNNPRARITFREWGRKLLMTAWLKPLPEGIYSCPGVIEPPLKVTLPRKVKLSKLWDGATYPPRPAIERR
jgi:hypothetical protein